MIEQQKAPTRCELCGAIKTTGGVDHEPPVPDAVALLHRLSDMAWHTNELLNVVLLSIHATKPTFDQVAVKLNITKQAVDERCKQADLKFPGWRRIRGDQDNG